MIVRSKYFVHHDRAFSSEPDTQSEESDHAEGTPEHVEGATPTKKRNRLVESCLNSKNSVDEIESCRKLLKMEDCYTAKETHDETLETEKMQRALRKENANVTIRAISALESQKLSPELEYSSSTMVDTQSTTNDSNFYNSATSFAVGAALSSKTNTVLESPTSSCNSSTPELLGSDAKSYVQTAET